MTFVYNSPSVKNKRTRLRNTPTDAERLVWSILRKNQIQGLRFFRQYSVGIYILDFYCPKIRLAIEIDGGQHDERRQYDEKRTKLLQQQNIKVIRFWNNEVMNNLPGVYEKITETINNS